MAFIADLLGSLATYGGQMLAEERKSNMELERNKKLADYRAGIEMDAQERLAKIRADIERENDRIKAELKAEFENKAREQKKSAVDSELSKIADQQAGQRFKTADESADTTGENYGNEVQRANGFIGQAQQEARANFVPTGNDMLRANINAGYEDSYKLATIETQEKAAASKAERTAAELEFRYENMKRLAEQAKDNNNVRMMIEAIRAAGKAGSGGSGGEGGDTAKLRQAQTYMDNVNKERAARGEQPITWEDAYNAANYAPKISASEKLDAKKADAVAKFMALGYEGDDLDKKVAEYMRAASPSKPDPKQGDKSGRQPQASAIPPQAIAALKLEPNRAAEFDAKYGKDASKQYLGK